ncbi:protein SCAR1 isoform X2 [Sesamum indicum]|uniref:Protein SCAR n=1 Tax=Sesamum indicum TaxID=4182 RepID=A0A6I9TR19_SESIN|nr:protein SCAR1 isoform X2 [Sesamum indicum]
MPLVRVEVRNEYALGAPDLYRAVDKEDPKEILDGVAVAGLVGVLRQLGDLAEFSAEVFHGLQEEVMRTSSRSRKLMARVQRIEASVSPLEKAVLAQRSHLHFAYTAGSNWRTRIRCEQNHFVCSDVPQFIMNSYEDSRAPPRLHLLDRFDPGGPGSCLKRYSDPTFFNRASMASMASGEANNQKISKDKKGRKIKKRRSWPRSGEVSRDASLSYNSGRMRFTELNIGGRMSTSQTASTYDATLQSDSGEQSNRDMRNGSGYVERDFRPSYSVQSEEQVSRESLSSPGKRHDNDFLDYNFLEEKSTEAYDDIQINLSQEQAGHSSSSVTWDEKRESVAPATKESDNDGMIEEEDENRHLELFSPNLDPERLVDNAVDFGTVDKRDLQTCDQAVTTLDSGDVHLDDIESETDHFMDALNTIESECETDLDCRKNQEVEHYSKLEDKGVDDGLCELIRPNLEYQSSTSESNVLANSSLINGGCGHNLISVSSKSPYATSCSIDGVAAKDEVNSISPLDKALQSSQRTEESSTPASPHSVDSHESGKIEKDDFHFVYSLGKPLQSSQRTEESVTPGSLHSVDSREIAKIEKDEFLSTYPLGKPLKSSERTEDSLAPCSQHSVDSLENHNIYAANNVQSVSCTISSNFRDDRQGVPSTDSQKHAPEISNETSVAFWTNGSLLGLQPSKPPDCSVLNAIPQNPIYRKDGSSSSIQHLIHSDKDAGKPDQTESLKNMEEDPDMDGSTCHEYEESVSTFRKPSWKISLADLDIKLGKLGNSLYQNNASSARSSITASGNLPPANPASRPALEHQGNSSSSRMFELSNKLLSTGSNKKLLPGGDSNSYPGGYQNANAFEQKNCQSVGYRTFSGRSKDLFGAESPRISPASSPPLGHMKISFEPIDGFETSKLKLKFPNGNTNSESSSDIFPSFQLIPEVSIARHNVGSDSDTDTFYRSSPSLSDDCHSYQSESNSEQWEANEAPTSKDRDLYDALRRISLTESVSTVPDNGRTTHEGIHENCGLQLPFVENGVQKSESCRSFDLQSLDTINHSLRKELRNGTNAKDIVQPRLVPTPAPPPLPPVQWRGMIPRLDGLDDQCDTMPEGSYYAFDLMHSASTISQPKPAPFSEDQIDSTNMQKTKCSSRKSNGQRETNQGKTIDEKEDFLHQIRTKSFNLRPIATAKPTVPSGASANVQVTAILEKANAIRQAVSSDAEDDENWSDT